jgi:hypothetical protein
MSFSYKVFSYFSRFSKKEFRDERRNSILGKTSHGVSKELPEDRWRKTCKAVDLSIELEISNLYR